jgi:hypothetical protein
MLNVYKNKIMKNISLISFVFISILLIACQKDKSDDSPSEQKGVNSSVDFSTSMDAFNSLIGFFNVYTEGDLIIQDNHAFNNLVEKGTNLSAGFSISGIDELEINGVYSIAADEHDEFYFISKDETNIYGNDLDFTFLASDDTVFNDTLYVPKRMYVDYYDSIVDPGDTIYWNSDGSNNIGVGVVVYFSSEHSNEMGGKPSTAAAQMNYDLITDNGYYVIPTSILDGIPDSVYVSIHMGRGNWVTSASKVDPYTDSLNVLVFSMGVGFYFHSGN